MKNVLLRVLFFQLALGAALPAAQAAGCEGPEAVLERTPGSADATPLAELYVPEQTAPRETDATKPLATALGGTAAADYVAAKLLFADGDYGAALAKLRAAYAVSGDPRLLWNMAACHKQLRHYSAVHVLLTAYLAAGEPWVPPSDREQAEALRATMAGFVSALSLSVTPAGARVWVDGVPIPWERLRQPLQLDVGTHDVRVELTGFEATRMPLEVTGGGALSASIELEPLTRLGAVSLVTDSGAEISFDGKVRGSSFAANVPVSVQEAVFAQPGSAPLVRRLSVEEGRQSSLSVGFGRPKPPSGSVLQRERLVPAWIWLVGGTLLTGAAAGVLAWELEQRAP